MGNEVIPLLTALTGALVVLSGTLIARAATRYAAGLHAAQRRRDAEIAHLAEFRDAVIDALTSFAIFKNSLARITREDSKEATYEKAGIALEDIAGHSAFRTDTIPQLGQSRGRAQGADRGGCEVVPVGNPVSFLENLDRPNGVTHDGAKHSRAATMSGDHWGSQTRAPRSPRVLR